VKIELVLGYGLGAVSRPRDVVRRRWLVADSRC